MRRSTAVAVAALAIVAFTASIARAPDSYRAAGQISATAWRYFPGSVIPSRVDGFPVPYHVALVGVGKLLAGGFFEIPENAVPGTSTLIAGNARGLAMRNIRIGQPPAASRAFVAVASYDDGLIVHDARDFSVVGVLGTGGTASDAAIDRLGRVVVTDTQGTALTIATLAPWRVSRVEGVPFGDDVAIDDTTLAIFVTDRDFKGGGALSRVTTDGQVTHVVTGQTPEGLVIDERRQIVYVANVNDDTIAAVDAKTMRLLRRFHAVARVFSLELSPDGSRLYGISNQSASSPFAAAGAAVAIALDKGPPHVVARSADLTFPLGAALDASSNTLFVTDESLDVVDVLDARTLRAKRQPLPTCHTPWKPSLDSVSKRLYVPCARSDQVDVFDLRTLHRVAGAPFATGSYPLAVTVWHGRTAANRFIHR